MEDDFFHKRRAPLLPAVGLHRRGEDEFFEIGDFEGGVNEINRAEIVCLVVLVGHFEGVAHCGLRADMDDILGRKSPHDISYRVVVGKVGVEKRKILRDVAHCLDVVFMGDCAHEAAEVMPALFDEGVRKFAPDKSGDAGDKNSHSNRASVLLSSRSASAISFSSLIVVKNPRCMYALNFPCSANF